MYDNQCRDLVNGWDHKDDYVAFIVSVSGINRMADQEVCQSPGAGNVSVAPVVIIFLLFQQVRP